MLKSNNVKQVVITVLQRVLLSELKRNLCECLHIADLQTDPLLFARMELRLLHTGGFTSWPCRSAAYCKQLVKRNNQRRVTALREGSSRHPIIWAVGQKFQIRALRLCVQQFPLLPLISDTNPDGQHVSPQGTHISFPSNSLTASRTELYFRQNLLIRYTGYPRSNVQYFGRVFLMLNYTDITQNTYIQS